MNLNSSSPKCLAFDFAKDVGGDMAPRRSTIFQLNVKQAIGGDESRSCSGRGAYNWVVVQPEVLPPVFIAEILLEKDNRIIIFLLP